MKFLLYFFLFACTSCATRQNQYEPSMFLYIPESRESLHQNGYENKLESSNFYWKRIADTLENIQISNLDSGQFNKQFYIKIKTKDTLRIIDYIATKADSVFLNLNNAMLISYKENTYFITHGYSAKKTMYIISYRNPKVYNDKIEAVRILKSMSAFYSDSTNQKRIYKALQLLDTNWQNLPSKTKEEVTKVVDEDSIN